MDTRKGLSKELSREWNMHMKLNTGVSHLKNRRKLNFEQKLTNPQKTKAHYFLV